MYKKNVRGVSLLKGTSSFFLPASLKWIEAILVAWVPKGAVRVKLSRACEINAKYGK